MRKKQIGMYLSLTRRSFLIYFVCFLILTDARIASSYYYSSTNITIDSWIYTYIEKIEAFGLVDSVLYGTRPFTRIEAARILSEALKRREQMGRINHPADRILKRLERELRDELLITGYRKGDLQSLYIKPLEEMELRFIHISGKERRFFSPTATEGSPLVENNEGIVYGEGSNLQWRYGLRFQITEPFSFYVEPLMIINEEDDGRDNDWRLHKGYLKFTLFGVELEVGKDSLWWGQGYHGSLIMSNNAEPFRMIKIETPYPFILPSIFSYLGCMKISGFITKLDKNRPIDEPRMLGFRVDLKPHPLVEIGASRTIIFGGRGAPHIDLTEFLKILRGTNISGGADTSNQMAGFDWRLRIPYLRGLNIYGEHIGEDEAGSFPSKFGHLIGLYIPRLDSSGNYDLRIEFARTHTVFYAHGKWPYTYRGLLMGHHAGGDSDDLFVRFGWGISERIQGSLLYDYQKRGRSLRDSEKGNEFAIEIKLDTGKGSMNIQFGTERIENFNFNGSSRTNGKITLGFTIDL